MLSVPLSPCPHVHLLCEWVVGFLSILRTWTGTLEGQQCRWYRRAAGGEEWERRTNSFGRGPKHSTTERTHERITVAKQMENECKKQNGVARLQTRDFKRNFRMNAYWYILLSEFIDGHKRHPHPRTHTPKFSAMHNPKVLSRP